MANAAGPGLTDEEEAFYESRLMAFEVPSEHWDGLLDIAASDASTLADGDTAPESVTAFTYDGMAGTIERWSDGSFHWQGQEAATPVDAPPGSSSFGAMGVSDCSVYTGGGATNYSNCKVSEGNFFRSYEFYANYSRWSGGSRIESIRDYGYDSICSVTVNSFKIRQQTGYSQSNPAEARLSTTETCSGSATYWLQLNVSPSGAWTTSVL